MLYRPFLDSEEIPRRFDSEHSFTWSQRSKIQLGNVFHLARASAVSDARTSDNFVCFSDDAKRIEQLATEQKLLVFCDDVYNMLYYSDEIASRPFEVGATDNIVSSGTFSKLLSPGLRLGWLESSRRIIDHIAAR